MLCRGWASHAKIDHNENASVAAAVVSWMPLGITTILVDVLPNCFLHYVCWGSISHRPLSLSPIAYYCCVIPIISQICLQPQQNALNPLAVLPLLRPRLSLPYLHILRIAGIPGDAASISPPRRSPLVDICRIPGCMRLPDWNCECSPRLEVFLFTRGGSFRLNLPSPCPLSSTALGEGIPDVLLEDLCHRRRRLSPLTVVPKCENVFFRAVGPTGGTDAGGLTL